MNRRVVALVGALALAAAGACKEKDAGDPPAGEKTEKAEPKPPARDAGDTDGRGSKGAARHPAVPKVSAARVQELGVDPKRFIEIAADGSLRGGRIEGDASKASWHGEPIPDIRLVAIAVDLIQDDGNLSKLPARTLIHVLSQLHEVKLAVDGGAGLGQLDRFFKSSEIRIAGPDPKFVYVDLGHGEVVVRTGDQQVLARGPLDAAAIVGAAAKDPAAGLVITVAESVDVGRLVEVIDALVTAGMQSFDLRDWQRTNP